LIDARVQQSIVDSVLHDFHVYSKETTNGTSEMIGISSIVATSIGATLQKNMLK
jgi:hypothetical protein